jgi:hypothetical protein
MVPASSLGTRRVRSRPDLRSTKAPRLPATLDREIDTLLPCSGPAPLARPTGRNLWRRRRSTLETVRPSSLGQPENNHVLVRLEPQRCTPVVPLFSRPGTASPAPELSEYFTKLHYLSIRNKN